MKYKARIIKITIAPVGEPIYADSATTIEVDDEGGGEFVRVTQGDEGISINFDEWPLIKESIDKLVGNCGKRK